MEHRNDSDKRGMQVKHGNQSTAHFGEHLKSCHSVIQAAPTSHSCTDGKVAGGGSLIALLLCNEATLLLQVYLLGAQILVCSLLAA